MSDGIPPVHDYSRVDSYLRTRQKVAFLHAIWRPLLAGAAGAGLVIAAVAIGILATAPRFTFRNVEVPRVTMKDVTVPNIITKNVEIPVPRLVAPSPTPSAATPSPETHPFAEVTDKELVGIISSVSPRQICFDHQPGKCTWPALTDSQGHAVLDANGEAQTDPSIVFVRMGKWIGHEAWRAPSPNDPTRLYLFWVRDGDRLIRFTLEKIRAAARPGDLRL